MTSRRSDPVDSFIQRFYVFFVRPGPSPRELKNTPLHLACTNHHEEIAAALLVRGASASARNQYGITPYGVATKQAVKDVVQSVEKGGDLARGKLRATLAKKKSTEVRPPWDDQSATVWPARDVMQLVEILYTLAFLLGDVARLTHEP